MGGLIVVLVGVGGVIESAVVAMVVNATAVGKIESASVE